VPWGYIQQEVIKTIQVLQLINTGHFSGVAKPTWACTQWRLGIDACHYLAFIVQASV
jgi:hypothetical protein